MSSTNLGNSPSSGGVPGLGGSHPPSASSSSDGNTARRKILSIAVGCILQEHGITHVEKAVVGTMVELLQSTITEIGRTAKGYCEVASRTEPLIADIILAFADMGLNYTGLQAYGRRVNRSTVPAPQVQSETKPHNILQVGDKQAHHNHIPEHFPPFPDTHTYCFTPTVKQPVTEYEAIREKAATQKRDIEKALTKYATKTNPTESLFFGEDREFVLVCVAPTASQNIDALMPRDQVFEAELDYEVSKVRKRRQDRLQNFQQQQALLKQAQGVQEQEMKAIEPSESDVMDNPYLRPVKLSHKMPTRSKGNRHSLGPNINKIMLGGPVKTEHSEKPLAGTSEGFATDGQQTNGHTDSYDGFSENNEDMLDMNVQPSLEEDSYMENEEDVISPEARDRAHGFGDTTHTVL